MSILGYGKEPSTMNRLQLTRKLKSLERECKDVDVKKCFMIELKYVFDNTPSQLPDTLQKIFTSLDNSTPDPLDWNLIYEPILYNHKETIEFFTKFCT